MIDPGETRTAALENRILLTIWLMLSTIAVLRCPMLGYATRRRFWRLWAVRPLDDGGRQGPDRRSRQRAQQVHKNGLTEFRALSHATLAGRYKGQ